MVGGKATKRKEVNINELALDLALGPVYVSYIGKSFRCTHDAPCNGNTIHVYCVDWDVVANDFDNNCEWAPFCIRQTIGEGGTLNVTCEAFPNGKTQELFVAITGKTEIAGTYKFHLYYEGIEVPCSPISIYADIDWDIAQWYGYHQDEVWYNGNYTYIVEDPNGTIIGMQHFVVTGAQEPTEPEDTKIKCYDKETDVNVKVTLEAKLEEKAFPYYDIENEYVKFYMNGAYQGADYTDSNGKVYLDITPTAAGTYTIKTTFAATGDYNGCEDTCALTVNPKKDTKIKCYDAETEKNVKVTLEAKLEEDTFLAYDIENGYVKFYTATALIGGGYTDANGKAYVDYTPPAGGTFTITVVFNATDHYNGSQNTCILTVTEPAKKDTRLTCYDAETVEGSEATLEAKLEYKNLLWHDLEGKQVNFEIDTVDAIFGAITDSNGIASISFPAELIPPAGAYTFTATFIEDSGYYGSVCEGTLTVTPVGVCEYTGHASDAKIYHDDVPGSATEGSEVTCTVSVDCIEIGETRYRVKWILDGGTPAYSNDFLLGYIGEHDESYALTMPDNDVTLIAEVEWCNASGEWEPCEHADHIKTYTIALAEYEGPHGVIADGYPKLIKNSSEFGCTDTCEDDNPCTAEEGESLEITAKIKNAGTEAGVWVILLTNADTEAQISCTKYIKLESGEESEQILASPDFGYEHIDMLDTDFNLRVDVKRREGSLIDSTASFKVCYEEAEGDCRHKVILESPPEELHVGDTYRFKGTLTQDGIPVDGETIDIYDVGWLDEALCHGTTKSGGKFDIPWEVAYVGKIPAFGETKAEIRAYYDYGGACEAHSATYDVIIKGRDLVMAMVYGSVAVGVYVAGIFVPKLGKLVQAGSLIPAGLAGYEIYLWVEEKIPFMSTELEQLALPPKLTETLRKKKVLL